MALIGKFLNIKFNGSWVACSTSCKIDTEADTHEKSAPGDGNWRKFLVGRKSWSVTCSWLIASDAKIAENMLTVGSVAILETCFNGSGKLYGRAICRRATITASNKNLIQGSFEFIGDGALSDDSSDIDEPEEEGGAGGEGSGLDETLFWQLLGTTIAEQVISTEHLPRFKTVNGESIFGTGNIEGVSTAERSNWNTAYNFVNSITGPDADDVINKWDEIVAFLDGISETDKLNNILSQFLRKDYLDSMFVPVDAEGNQVESVADAVAIKAKLDLFSVGEVSAYGMGAGSGGSSSASTLFELDDTNISNPAIGQVLQYNGTSWVNAAAPSSFSASIQGTGSLIKDASVSGSVLTLTRGSITTSDVAEGTNKYYKDEYVTSKVNKAYIDNLGVTAEKANQLTTSVTLWGQSFNGSSNVSGSLTGVTSITMSGQVRGASQIYGAGVGTSEYNYGIYLNDNLWRLTRRTTEYEFSADAFTCDFSTMYVGIGTTAPSCKFDVNGEIRTRTKKIYFGTDSLHYIELTNDGFHFSHSLYSDGEVSAYGSSSGSGSSSAATLSELDDTNINNPVSGQVLQFNGTSWVNAAAPSSFSASIQGTGSFIKTASVSSNVLTLTKGNITSSEVTTALGFTPYNAEYFTKANIQSTLGISDWALAASKPAYTFSDITSKPTTVSGYGITDAITTANIGSQTVSKANKLTTARTLWGQSFDGTANVSGNLADVGSITMSGSIYATTGVTFKERNTSAEEINLLGLYIWNNVLQFTKRDTSNSYISSLLNIDISTENIGVGTSPSDGYKLDVNGDIRTRTKKIYFGTSGAYIELTSDGFHFSHSLYSDGEVSAYGSSQGCSSGGSGFDLLADWSNYASSTASSMALGANLGKGLLDRIASLEGGSAMTFKESGTGNAYTSFTKSGTVVTLKKDATFLTSHQSIYTLTFSAGSFSAGSYTPNSATKTIYVPTKTSNLTNDSGFITSSASITGNAATATAFASAKSITLTGDVTGSASSTGGWSIATTIGSGKVTNAMLAGSIANGKLANSSMTIAGTSVSLGGSISASTIGNALTTSAPAAYATSAGNADTVDNYHIADIPLGYGGTKVHKLAANGQSDTTWKVFATVSTTVTTAPTTNTYIAYSICGTICYQSGNYGQVSIIVMPFQAIFHFVGDKKIFDTAYLYLKQVDKSYDVIRIVKVTTNSYELQVRQPSAWTRWWVEASGYGGATATYNTTLVTATNTTVAVSAANATIINGDTAAYAYQLVTSRTLWGQSFNGTANVTGNMTDVGSITASGNITSTISTTSDICHLVANSNGKVGIYSSSNRGVYDFTKSNWIIATNGTNTWMPQGNVGIGTLSPSNKLHVVGDTAGIIRIKRSSSHVGGAYIHYYHSASDTDYWETGINTSNQFIWYWKGGTTALLLSSAGSLTATNEITAYSDIRKKDVVEETNINLEDIANAPLFKFVWNDREDDKLHIGTSAQYWLDKCPNLVSGDENTAYSLNYGALGTAMGISIARHVRKLEQRIKELEKQLKMN